MKKKLLYVGIDVDTKGFSCCAVDEKGSKFQEDRIRPNAGALRNWLEKLRSRGFEPKCCYEACYPGFSLHRVLSKEGYDSTVIAASLAPKSPGKKVKTDRLDAERLAIHFAKGLLTPVYVPDEQDEAVRDLIRSRRFLVDQLSAVKLHINSICRRHGWDYRDDKNSPNANYWTAPHLEWLRAKIRSCVEVSAKVNLNHLLTIYTSNLEFIEIYNQEIEIISTTPRYSEKVKVLRCFRGIDTLSAMLFAAELGDIRRFSHPRKLTSYIGMDLIEYSSGGVEKKRNISKLGNSMLRKTAVECSQIAHKPPTISRALKQRREGAPSEYLDVADRCMKRLYAKGSRLQYKGKPINKVKVACARELMSFIWEALMIEGQYRDAA